MPFPSTHPALAQALAARGYAEPTPVQEAVLQPDLVSRDLLVSAQTGSGKTVAFGLAFATTLLGEAEMAPQAGAPLGLIIAPTRELAMQVHDELTWLYAGTGARVVACVGGMDARREQRALANGCHIVVGTPGRLRDHMERGQLDLSALRVAVLDEADEMLDLGFREELEAILQSTPPSRRTLLFSATIPREIVTLARTYQRDAHRLELVSRHQSHADIAYNAIRIFPNEVEAAVVNLLRYHNMRATLVFCATREAVRRLHAALQNRGFGAVALSGELSQAERTQALASIRSGRARVCVATDVAARGLDVPELDLVIHADLPIDRDTLLHRSGRTGRAGRKGLCAILIPHPARRRAERLFEAAGITVTWIAVPSAEKIGERDRERLLSDPMLTVPPSDSELAQARVILGEHTAEAVGTALVRLFRSHLPAPEHFHTTQAEPPVSSRAAIGPQMREARRTSWFRIGIGRRRNADPKWLLPMICRLGEVTRADIGAIRVLDHETRFEVSQSALAGFTAALQRMDKSELAIEPAETSAPIDKADTRFRSSRKDKRRKH
jgi:ATP-dependent RNA helicase DeaD